MVTMRELDAAADDLAERIAQFRRNAATYTDWHETHYRKLVKGHTPHDTVQLGRDLDGATGYTQIIARANRLGGDLAAAF